MFTLLLIISFLNIAYSGKDYQSNSSKIYSDEYIKINLTNPEYVLTPSLNEIYNPGVELEWKFQIDTENETFVLRIEADINLMKDDQLIIYDCNTKSVLHNTISGKDSSQHYFLYTQEEKICVLFNSLQETDILDYQENLPVHQETYYWIIHMYLELQSFTHQVKDLVISNSKHTVKV